MNLNMVKPEKFGHLHVVFHFTVPLKGWGVVLAESLKKENLWQFLFHKMLNEVFKSCKKLLILFILL